MTTQTYIAPTAHSHSRLQDYSGCPLSYRLKYIDKVGTDDSDAMQIGSAAHEFFDRFVKAANDLKGSPAGEALDRIVLNMAGVAFQSQPRDQSNFKEYLEICQTFAANYRPDPAYPVSIPERAVAFDRQWKVTPWFSKDVMFRVKIDRIDEPRKVIDDHSEITKIRIVDYKTGYSGAINSFQLDIYALAGSILYPHLEQVEVEFYYTQSGYKQVKLLDVKDLDITKIQLESLMHQIEKDTNFKAKPGARCLNCGVASFCDQKPSNLVAITKIEQAETLAAEVAFLDAQAKAKKKSLKAWCEKQGPVTTNGLTYNNWPQESLKIEMAPLLSLCVQYQVDPAGILNTDSTAIKKIFKADPSFAEAIAPFTTVETKTAFRSKKAEEE